MSFAIGDIVGTYRIVGSIGSGAMGEVFEVEHVITKRVEAMKVLTPDVPSTPEQDQRFLREIQLQARLSHPNIAAVHNAFRENGHLVLIMELIQGRSLRVVLESGKPPLPVSLEYACQALAALEYGHEHGVVHRDVSPSNMLVTEAGTLKLTDFGVAKSSTDVRLTQSGALLGSLYYTSPEQVKGSDTIDARSDIYSLGAVLYEMTTGAKPFDSENPFTLMLAHVEQPPPVPSEKDPKLPPDLDEVLLKALDKDPEKRFQSAELFRCALEAVKDGRKGRRRAHSLLEQRFQREVRFPAPAAAVMETAVPAKPDSAPAEHAAPELLLSISSPAWRRLLDSRLLKAAAILIFVIVFSRVWKSALFPGYNSAARQAAYETTAEAGYTSLPILWPSERLLIPQLTYPAARRSPRTYSAQHRTRKDQASNKTHGTFRRAMSRIVHPIRRNNQTDQP